MVPVGTSSYHDGTDDRIRYSVWKQRQDIPCIYPDRPSAVQLLFKFDDTRTEISPGECGDDQESLCAEVYLSAVKRTLKLCNFSDLTDRAGYRCSRTGNPAYNLYAADPNRTDPGSSAFLWMWNDSCDDRSIFQGYGISLVSSTDDHYVYLCDLLLSFQTFKEWICMDTEI